MEQQLFPQELFGGAVVVMLPRGTDASTIRPVPDNQEVFLFEDGSLIVEIVEESGLCTADHFKDIAAANQAGHAVAEREYTHGDWSVVEGLQKIGKEQVFLVVCSTTFTCVEADVLVTFHLQEGSPLHGAVCGVLESFTVLEWGLFK
ncbi:MAG: Ran GTPase binding protein Mog1 [Amphiamblys sp. WSBS2006]|nr:MAG: Ran GTPase binding protein Mog1 [Amphiamblys sp. WSBS2006]